MKLRSICLFKRFDASCANVTVGFFTIRYVGNFLNVCFKRSSGFTVGVANVVARGLTFTANIAYSRHIDTSEIWNYFYHSYKLIALKSAPKSVLFKQAIII
jgi:hypothetical protein